MLFSKYLENIFDDDFDMKDWREKLKKRGKVVDRSMVSVKDTLEVYHGFNQDPSSFNYEFDPQKSQQGLLWFTHKYIRAYNPIEYATDRGKYLLTYQLPIIKYYDMIVYEDGSKEKNQPEKLMPLVTPLENCRFMAIYEYVIKLPKNWFFTYKHEKFIGTSNKIKVSKNQIKENI